MTSRNLKYMIAGTALGMLGLGALAAAGPLDPPSGTPASTSPSLADIANSISAGSSGSNVEVLTTPNFTSGGTPQTRSITLAGPGVLRELRFSDQGPAIVDVTNFDVIVDGVTIVDNLDDFSQQIFQRGYDPATGNDEFVAANVLDISFESSLEIEYTASPPTPGGPLEPTQLLIFHR